MNNPLVSIICLCYNQKRYLKETLDSVFSQTYDNIEIIVVDDGSGDGSKELIRDYLSKQDEIPFVNIEKNVGNTTAFNRGLAQANGKYIVDLACDDVFSADRIEKQVRLFESQAENVGVIYSDAHYIDEDGNPLITHFSNKKRIPFEGDVYEKVVATYFLPPQTMMIRKSVFDELGGYDESLAYEDFDFWVRSARNWHYGFQNEILTKVRKVKGSHSDTLYKKGDLKLKSTLEICRKIQKLNQTENEDLALIQRLKYEFRHAFLTGCKVEAKAFYAMMKEMGDIPLWYKTLSLFNRFGVDWSFIRNVMVGSEI